MNRLKFLSGHSLDFWSEPVNLSKVFSHELRRDARVRSAFPVPEILIELCDVGRIREAAALFKDLEHLVDLLFGERLVELLVVHVSGRL